MNKDKEQREKSDKKPDHIKKTAANIPPDCSLCGGQTEWMQVGSTYVCHFCGTRGRRTQ
jgi:hypothetical protein